MLALLFTLLALSYPLAVYAGLQHLEPRALGLLIAIIFAGRLLFYPSQNDNSGSQLSTLLPLVIPGVLCGLVSAIYNSPTALRFTPVVMSFSCLLVFAATLWRPPTMAERLARLSGDELDERGIAYTYKVTIAWCLFFLFNGCIALFTATRTSLETWTLYNGLIAYILMGILFAIEYLVRMRVKARAA